MNSAALPPDHGFPLRLVVPGWIGVASIKWLGQIEVTTQEVYTPFNSTLYRMTGPSYSQFEPPLSLQAVKSAFELARGATLAAGQRHALTGRSWSGKAPIARVEVSIDQGATWHQARLHGPNTAGAWVHWTYSFPPQPAGTYELWARATDATGRAQPATVPFNTGGYLFWAIVKHPIVLQ
jgi:DMSO/TMAO reductase YedYZ molybdopterin-dependent catalytic subunit